MLSKDEESQIEEILAQSLAALNVNEVKSNLYATNILYKLIYLAHTCKELNTQLSAITEEYHKTNDELAKLREHYEG